jgi:exodeoxyribonuclease III
MLAATWNVNGLRARFDFVLHWLRNRQPDIAMLQELKLTDEQFPYMELEAEGYFAGVHGQKAWNGVAVLSREKPLILQTGLPGQELMGSRLIACSVGNIKTLSVYIPNGKSLDHPDFERKLAWIGRLRSFLAECFDPDDSVLVSGDLNLCPTSLDTWNEEALGGTIFHTERERKLFGDLTDWGLHDLYRRLHPDEQAFSWWDYRAGAFHRNQGLRIDFLLATARLAERAVRVEIDRDYRKKKDGLTPSDHAPVLAEFRD